jgi:hypothetical protein
LVSDAAANTVGREPVSPPARDETAGVCVVVLAAPHAATSSEAAESAAAATVGTRCRHRARILAEYPDHGTACHPDLAAA